MGLTSIQKMCLPLDTLSQQMRKNKWVLKCIKHYKIIRQVFLHNIYYLKKLCALYPCQFMCVNTQVYMHA